MPLASRSRETRGFALIMSVVVGGSDSAILEVRSNVSRAPQASSGESTRLVTAHMLSGPAGQEASRGGDWDNRLFGVVAEAVEFTAGSDHARGPPGLGRSRDRRGPHCEALPERESGGQEGARAHRVSAPMPSRPRRAHPVDAPGEQTTSNASATAGLAPRRERPTLLPAKLRE